MSETTQAGSSPAEVDDVFQGQEVSLAEFSKYRADGEVPTRFKTAEKEESETSDTQEKTEESESESPEEEYSESEADDAKETQEQVPDKTAKRIKQLLAERHELTQKLAAATKTDVKPESSTPQPQPQNYKEWFKTFDADKWVKDFAEANPTLSYERANASMSDFLGDVRDEFRAKYMAQQAAVSALKTTLDQARMRYDDADDVIFPAAHSIHDARIPQTVKEVFELSDSYIDLCYVVGSDPDELKKFIRLAETNPRAAIGKVFEYERGIKDELGKGSDATRDSKGKFTTPEPKKTTAPKPPSTVGGTSTKAFDVSDESLSPEEWMRKRNTDIERKRKA